MLGRKIRRHHAMGVTFAIIGYFFVGLSSMINGDALAKYSPSGLLIGILMIVVSNFTQGFLSNVEEMLMRKYEIEPQRMVGLEGFFGVIWIFISIMIFSYIPCPEKHLCDVLYC